MPKWKRRKSWILIEVASNDKNWVSYDEATWGDHNSKGFMILARSVCEIMAIKSKLGHFSTPPISQEKSRMAQFFVLSGHLSKEYFFTKQRVDSPHSYETCLFNGQTDTQTTGRRWIAIWQAQLTLSVELIIQAVGLRSWLSNVKNKQYGGAYNPFLGEPKKGDIL
jgi:hypothetical protein